MGNGQIVINYVDNYFQSKDKDEYKLENIGILRDIVLEYNIDKNMPFNLLISELEKIAIPYRQEVIDAKKHCIDLGFNMEDIGKIPFKRFKLFGCIYFKEHLPPLFDEIYLKLNTTLSLKALIYMKDDILDDFIIFDNLYDYDLFHKQLRDTKTPLFKQLMNTYNARIVISKMGFVVPVAQTHVIKEEILDKPKRRRRNDIGDLF